MARSLGQNSIHILKTLFHAGGAGLDGLLADARKYDRRIYFAMANLEKGGYVKREKKKERTNESFFHLTPKGRLSFLKHLHLEKIHGKKWDGHWRIAIFDVPEDRKKLRENFRHYLKYLGFQALQESVYITPYPVMGDLDELLKKHGARKHFRYLTVTEIDDEDELKEKFDLK